MKRKQTPMARLRHKLQSVALENAKLLRRIEWEAQQHDAQMKEKATAHAHEMNRVALELDAARVPVLIDQAARVAYLRDVLVVAQASANNLQRLVESLQHGHQMRNEQMRAQS